MKTPSLRAVADRLEVSYALLPGKPADPEEAFERYESVAIAILDSEHDDFIPGQLQEYLETRLYLFRLEHDLIPFPDPIEE